MNTYHSAWLQVSRAVALFCAGFIAAFAHASTVATPAFSPVAGTYTSAQAVTITSTTSGASIRYTTDGSTPSTTTGTIYSGPVSISATASLKAIAYETGFTNSAIKSGTYTIKVIAPVFSPAAGTYTSAQSVTITSTTSGASLAYTTDGTTPTESGGAVTNGTLYSGPAGISQTTTLKAIAYETGLTNSAVTSGTYTINLPPAATPTFSPAAGTYTSVQSVTITSTTSGSSIRYTTDGSTPSATAGTIYSSPVSISTTTTLKAIAYEAGFKNSAVKSGTYTINLPTAAAPVFGPPAGNYNSAQTISITTTTSGASIRYTTDGSIPSATAGTLYSGPVSIGTTTTLEAVAYKANFNNSTITSGTYTITPPPMITSSSTATGQVDAAFSYQITATNNPTSYNTTELPPGLSVDTSTGLITGTPTIAATGNVTISASNSGGVGSATLLLTVNPEPVTFTVSPVSFTYNGSVQGPTITSSVSGATYSTSGTASATSAGSYTVTATATGNYTGTSGPIAWTMAKATPVVTWSPPTPIVYGTALDATQLNATPDVPGAFTYTPNAGTVLDVGAQTLSAAFTPSDATDYNNASASVSLQVNAEPVTFAVSPVSFTYTGNTQGPTITPSVSGATYSTSGTASATSAGSYTVTATATGNYTGTSGPIAWTMAKATPVISWAAPSPIVYGTMLDTTELNATSDLPGSFTYTPDTGTVLNVGTQTLSVEFAPTDAIDYNNASASVSLTVNPPPPSTPVFSPAGGSFSTGQSVSITSLGTDSIYYTTDGTAPTTSSTPYAGAMTISNNTVLQAIGVNSGGTSPVASATFTILPPAPSLDPLPATYSNVTTFSVTISATAGSTIYYTTDGSTPTTASTQYISAVSLSIGTTTLSAIAITANGSSAVTTGTYILTPPPPSTPIFSPAGGSFTTAQSVTITSLGADSIYYTTDGSTPTPSSTLYSGAVTISHNTVLQAIGGNSGGTSPVASATFTILPPAPSLDPLPATYSNVTTFPVTVSDTASSTIYYTTDGTTPTASSTQYTAAVSLPLGTTTLSAIAINANGSSAVTAGTYILTPPPPLTPVFSPAGGSFTSAQSVTITSAGADSIYYTTDGSTPTPSSTLYTEPVTISNNAVLKVIGVNSGGNSPVASATYTIIPPSVAPVFSPAVGTYASAQVISITTTTSGATIRYTTDGSTPTETNGTIYSGPVSISHSTILKAIAYETGFTDSPVTGGFYGINSSPTVCLNVMHDFASANSGGTGPAAGLVQGSDGNFYGTTETGGVSFNGTVFRMTPSGVVTTLVLLNGTNGAHPYGGLVQGTDSDFYGATYSGGTTNQGTVFKMTPAGALTTLVSFNGANGANPYASLVQGGDGNFYGTTSNGGSGNLGTVFKVTPAGTLTTLVSFNGTNGSGLFNSLVQGTDGNLYGTTKSGGSAADGTVFKMTPAGVLTTLVTFTGANGSNPMAGLVQGSDGNFYGTTYTGLGSNINGTVFKMTPTGVLTTLAAFNAINGGPSAALLQGSDGYFYGTTAGINGNNGIVFRITPAGILTALASFDGANGAHLAATLVQGNDGTSYGTTYYGGVFNQGVVFQLIVPPTTVAPVFGPAAGNYASPQSVTITSTTTGATIRYTTDGSIPTETNGILYSGPVNISTYTTLQAIAYASAFADSPVTGGTYTFGPPPPAPVFSLAAGTYTSAQSVTITCAGATAIRYTIDGSVPTSTSTPYTGPVVIANTTILRALGFNSGGPGPVTSASYTIQYPQNTNFNLGANSTTLTVFPGESIDCTITVTPVNGFNGIVNLGVSGLPAGVVGTFNPISINGTGHSLLTISASTSALPGIYPFGITGTCSSPSLSNMVPLSLKISSANSPLQQAATIVSQMSLAEEVSQTHGYLGISYRYIQASANAPQFNFTNGPAGIGNNGAGHGGPATAMPAPIALAASFDINLAYLYGSIVGQEAADYSNAMIEGPDINIARVPQNGRTFEAYGEDPYLVGQIAVNTIEGLQDQGISAEAKHFAGNNQETNRMLINDIIDERTLREIYLPAFEASVVQGHVDAVMGAYNQVNGFYCCENMSLLHDILKGEWGFTGYTTSDFGAMNSTIGSALAGLDAEMPTENFYGAALQNAVQTNQLPKSAVDEMLIRRFSTMINRGVFHAPLPNKAIPATADGVTSRQIAEAGMVLLKNNTNTLPFKTSQLQSIALIGPFATSAMTGGNGSSQVVPIYTPVTPLAGIQSRVAGTGIIVQLNDGSNLTAATTLARNSTVAIVMVGDIEMEGADVSTSLSGNQYPNQDALVQAVAAANPHTVVVLKTGTAVLMPWINQVPAIIEAWYPGEEDGNAVAAVLFGDVNPSGKLPLTFPAKVSDCPANTPAQYPGINNTANYSEGIFVGYRHYDAHGIAPLFPFGYGLSYTTFQYQNLVINPISTTFAGNPNQTVSVDLNITNTGPVAGSEVAQIYVHKPALPNGLQDAPQWLKGFQKVTVTPGQTGHVHVILNFRSFAFWNVTTHAWTVAPGTYSIGVGSSSRDIRLVGQVTIN